jgi:phosphoribosylglycinamide formyltransferase-1
MHKIAFIGAGQPIFLEMLIAKIGTGELQNAKIAVVISEKPDSPILSIAAKYRIPHYYIGKGVADSDAAMRDALTRHNAKLALLAGYRYLVGPKTLAVFPGRVLNFHTGPLPRFGGKGFYNLVTTQAVLDAGVAYGGPTIHVVDEQYDHGQVLGHWPIKVRPDDTAQSLMDRTMSVGRKLYIQVVKDFLERLDNPDLY